MHPVVGREKGPSKLEQRAIAWVIQRLNAGYPLGKKWFVLFYVAHELSFGVRRTYDQNRAGLGDGLRHVLEELLVNGRMAAIPRIRLVMNMLVWMAAADS